MMVTSEQKQKQKHKSKRITISTSTVHTMTTKTPSRRHKNVTLLTTSSKKVLEPLDENTSSKLIDVLIPLWDDFQQSNDDDDDTGNQPNNISCKIQNKHSTTVGKIQKQISTYYKNNSIEVFNQSAQQEIQLCMKHFFNCAVQSSAFTSIDDATIDGIEKENEDVDDNDDDDNMNNKSKKTSKPTTSKHSIDKVVQLSAAITATQSITSLDSCTTMLQYVEQISRTPSSEMFRSISCQWIGYLVHSILHEQCNNRQRQSFPIGNLGECNDNSINNSNNYNDILDMASQALIPRFTDKSQIVRMAAIYAGTNFFVEQKIDATISTTTDPDILQSMIWSLQHDPSPINRLVSCTVIPINLETIDYIITRIRDVKPKVRCAAIQRLYNTFSPSSSHPSSTMSIIQKIQLEPSQAAACVMAGWTNRYVFER
jgi:hypothetical protein